ncbi:3-hydroxyacyl-CoA dehydrogenase [Nocardioides sp. CBS4Y-1]|uniref:3-hydroxyacyl-CoA dehydrogenase n=1 Tax=Nocardioides acrostichi TaxID=2784339 RepID=A0A930Y6A5_9ACTN|nr:3-hydroxyacyl-CoA dehydrogenase [Nocardioides acrostichi]
MRKVTVVGTGSIGRSWAALALARDLEVIATDPAPGAAERLRGEVARHLTALGAEDRLPGLTFEPEPRAAVAAADLVIEAGPERLDLKRDLFCALDDAAPPDVLLASSSSGFGPSAFQGGCRHPERVVVTHPFNPPHLVPLVEVVGGRATSPETVESAMAAMRRLGRRPIHVRAELPGHVVNRLQAALWREAYHLVGTGAVSVADLDAAVASGPGLRWALLGPIATQHLSGGPGGLGHVLEHLGPPMVDWWHALGDPDLTPDLVDRLVDGVATELEGRDEEIRGRRDQALLALLELKRQAGLDPQEES